MAVGSYPQPLIVTLSAQNFGSAVNFLCTICKPTTEGWQDAVNWCMALTAVITAPLAKEENRVLNSAL